MAQETSRRTRKGPRVLRLLFNFKKNGGLPLLFLLLTFLPLAEMVLDTVPDFPMNEKRKLAAKPELLLLRPWDAAKGTEAYFNDHFGFRTWLLHYHNLLTVRLFRVSPTAKVLVGKRGWLFTAKETEQRNEVDNYRALRPFSRAELEHWRRMLGQRRAWLQERGIAYLFVVVPNKSTIYPEHMPAAIRRLREHSRLDQLLAALRQEAGFPVIDLRPALLAAKKTRRVYNKTDSHWNELGAYFAFVRIMESLAPSFPQASAPGLDQFTIHAGDRIGGDLAQMLSLQKSLYREQAIRLRPRTPVAVTSSRSSMRLGPRIRGTISECPAAALPPLLVVHDSFIHQLKPHLGPHFKRIVYLWDWGLHFFPKVIAAEKPGIVIEEIAERMLCDLVLENPPGLDRAARR